MTELTWDGKYKDGKKQGPVRIALPFQTIETVNESAQDRRRNLELFASGRDTEWRNRLIWGDKKYVLPSLLPEFAGKVNLIYIDPPFDTGADFSFTTTIPDTDDSQEFVKEASVLEQKAYRDTWGRGMDSYLQWFYETCTLLRELLTDTGSLIVHLDYRVGQYAKIVLDELFGADNLVDELIWYYAGAGVPTDRPAKRHDNLLWYAKGQSWTFNADEVRTPYAQATQERFKHYIGNVRRGSADYGLQTLNPKGKWPDDVLTISIEAPSALERTGYPTQKPRALLDWIVRACSNAGDLVLDCFVGSGTTALVVEKLNRMWIAGDLSRFAIHTTRKRLLGIPNVRPFAVQNLGKYERQEWQMAQFPANGQNRLEEQREREAAYRNFILDLYHAKSISGHTWLHGAKSGRMVHVAAVDAPVTLADVKAIARETWKAGVTGKDAHTKAGVDVLGWEFAFEVNELAKQVAAESRVDVAFKKIPREVLDKKAVEQGDVKFFELGALSLDLKQKGRTATLKLSDFVIPTDDIPEEARKAIKHWSQLVDYWAVDWDFKNDTFHNQWQAYRTRKDPKIELETKYEYKEPGKYQIVVKAIDILGNDTTKTLEIAVK